VRRFAGTLIGLVALGGGAARAQTPDDRGADRRDLYLRLGGGPGYSSGSYRFSGITSTVDGPPAPLTFESTLHGAHGEFELGLGNAVARGIAILATVGGRLAPVLSHQERLGETTLEGALGAKAGLGFDVFPLSREAVHFTAGAGWAAARFLWSRNEVGSPENIVDPELVTGPYGEAGVGCLLTARLDLLVRVSYAALDGSQSAYRPLGVTVLASHLRF
jgi:hypothetical protein